MFSSRTLHSIVLLIVIWVISAGSLASEADLSEFDLPLQESDIPVVLSAARLKQPRAEVPASVTVIEAEQIAAWGVRSLPDLLRFVPGVFVTQEKYEHNHVVAYHGSTAYMSRRLQVLVDGLSVYKGGIAMVVWDDIPIALEDIQRIEFVRGPSSALYGANAFLGVVSITSKKPADTEGVRVSYRAGNQEVRDVMGSISTVHSDSSSRLTMQQTGDSGFDGVETDSSDALEDSRRHGFATGYYAQNLDDGIQLSLQGGYKYGYTDVRKGLLWQEPRSNFVKAYYGSAQADFNFSASHQSYLRVYWQFEKRTQEGTACIPITALDSDLYSEWEVNPQWAKFLGFGLPLAFNSADPALVYASNQLLQQLAFDSSTPDELTAIIEQALGERYTLSQDDVDLAKAVVLRAYNGSDFSQFGQTMCTDANLSYEGQRSDFEWQDTVQWTDTLRSVTGINIRQDNIKSETYFGGMATSYLYRAFANLEWRATESIIFNVAGTYEYESINTPELSPHIALNYLLSPRQSVRFVYSTAIRSPDSYEQNPDYQHKVSDIPDNYLGVQEATYFIHQVYDNRHVESEKITSYEVGYYHNISSVGLEMDIKLYREELTQLISQYVGIAAPSLSNDTEMSMEGVDWQFQWEVNGKNWLRFVGAYLDTEVRPGSTYLFSQDEIDEFQTAETRLSAEYSGNVSWHHKGEGWNSTFSYFWNSAYDSNEADPNDYRRYEVNLQKLWRYRKLTPSITLFWHHLVDDGQLLETEQVYATNDLYSIRFGVNF
ncbi:TonB-dependent receptor plug domain-containing protein [Thalassolituus sp.]|uniref:TonB-dependent receptor plug domain-containing protein n=1 Tax=Thalassolituus sp. TaxID=2030822 RepID=UPI002A81ED36|nr:TonB-dependent receptor [Thalassolituus sp.]